MYTAPATRGRIDRNCVVRRERGRGRRRLGDQLVADLGTDTHQVAPRGLHVALTEGEPHAGLDLLGNGHAMKADIQADQVPHPGIAAELAAPC
jgi:hypothetical protein